MASMAVMASWVHRCRWVLGWAFHTNTRMMAASASHILEMARPTRVRSTKASTWPSFGSCRSSRSEEHTSELQSLMRISYAVFCLKKKTNTITSKTNRNIEQTLLQNQRPYETTIQHDH